MTAAIRIVRIGSSRGIRVPKILLDDAGLPEKIELRAERGKLVVSAAARPRFDGATQPATGAGAREDIEE